MCRGPVPLDDAAIIGGKRFAIQIQKARKKADQMPDQKEASMRPSIAIACSQRESQGLP